MNSIDEITPRARQRADELVAAFDPDEPSAGDLRCVKERQLRHKAQVVGVSPRCRHGFPQAFVFDPVGYKISSGLFRLSCPLLVKAVDQLEAEGGVETVNARLEEDQALREVGPCRLRRLPFLSCQELSPSKIARASAVRRCSPPKGYSAVRVCGGAR